MRQQRVFLNIGRPSITLGFSWLLIAPLVLVATARLYVPVMAPTLSPIESWGVAAGILILTVLSLVVHALAHMRAAQLSDSERPSTIPLYPFGDAAQVWPAAPSPGREAMITMAGPVANLLLAGLAYLTWDRQLHPYVNVSAIFLAVTNGGLAAINLAPGFPLDGGRLVRAIVWDLAKRPDRSTELGVWLGRVIVLALTGWGLFLVAQQARFSLENGIATIFIAGILLLALRRQPAWQWNRPRPSHRLPPLSTLARGTLAGILVLALLGVTFSLVPTNNGLEAPGVSLAVESMIQVPPEYRYPMAGSFLLTTVIPQTPITAGQWAYAKWSPVIKLVPPERIVPRGTTPQQLAERGNEMLDESKTIASVVGLRLAGYDVQVAGESAQVTSILSESPAQGELQPGDRITALNGEPIKTANELATRIHEQDPAATIDLTVKRGDETLEFTLPLMQPAEPDEPPRLGILVETVGFGVDLPIPVEIVPQKISGGPSAGLMFTLTVYNLVTPEDLTGGRKIAGTGTINLDGVVGPIGGVEQKVASAEGAGAEYFLAPPENYEDARRVAGRIEVVEVRTAEAAIEFLEGLPAEGQ